MAKYYLPPGYPGAPEGGGWVGEDDPAPTQTPPNEPVWLPPNYPGGTPEGNIPGMPGTPGPSFPEPPAQPNAPAPYEPTPPPGTPTLPWGAPNPETPWSETRYDSPFPSYVDLDKEPGRQTPRDKAPETLQPPAGPQSPSIPAPTGPGGGGGGGGFTMPSIPLQKTPAPQVGPKPYDPWNDMVRSRLKGFLEENLQPVDYTDPNIARQMAAYQRQSAKALEQRRGAAGERLAAMGLGDSGAMVSAQERAIQDSADASGAFAANLMYEETKRRADNVKAALDVGAGILTADEKNQLERDLANLNANLEQQRIDLTGRGQEMDYALGVGGLQTTQRGQDITRELGLGGLANERRGQDITQQLGLGRLDLDRLLGMGDLDLRRTLGLGGLDIERGRLDLDKLLGMGGLDVQKQRLALEGELGRGRLDLDRMLGKADIDLRKYGIDVQKELGLTDAEVRRYGIDQQTTVAMNELALRKMLGSGQLNLGLLQLLMQNQQFNDTLGFDIGKWISELNKGSVSSLL